MSRRTRSEMCGELDGKLCYAWMNGQCRALRDTDFGDKPCPFFKTDEEYREGIKKYGGVKET